MSMVIPKGLTRGCMGAWLFLSLSFAWADTRESEAPVVLSNPPLQGAMVLGHAPTATDIWLADQALPLTADGQFVFGLGKDATEAQVLKARLQDGSTWQMSVTPLPRTFDVQRIDGLPENMVSPPPEVLDRIQQEAGLARAARQRISDRIGFTESFIWPVKGRITGVYGSQRILNGEPRAPHWGIDIAAPTGTPVMAPASGEVVLVHEDMYFSGGTLFLDHGHGLMSSFLHLERIDVAVGDEISQGQVIATVGATGRATGPHLDWRVSWRDVRVDAGLLVPAQ